MDARLWQCAADGGFDRSQTGGHRGWRFCRAPFVPGWAGLMSKTPNPFPVVNQSRDRSFSTSATACPVGHCRWDSRTTARREAKGLSQDELAAARVSQQLITSIETGMTRTTKFLMRLAAALDVPPGQLDPDWAMVSGIQPLMARSEPPPREGSVPGSAPPASQRDLPIHSSVEGGEGFIIVTSDAVD